MRPDALTCSGAASLLAVIGVPACTASQTKNNLIKIGFLFCLNIRAAGIKSLLADDFTQIT